MTEDEDFPGQDPRCMMCGEQVVLNNIRRASDHKTVGYLCTNCESNLLAATSLRVNLRMYLMLHGWRCVRWYGIEAWTHRELQVEKDPIVLGLAIKLQVEHDLQKAGY